MPLYPVKEKLAAGQPVFGTMITECLRPKVVAALAACGVDFFIDTDHSLGDLHKIEALARAARHFGIAPLGRNALRGPGQANLDFALQKRFAIREKVGLNFRTELFNIFNDANFSNPSSNFDSSTFGVISSTAANARIIQFAMKLTY